MSELSAAVVNIAAYKFARLADLKSLRLELRDGCAARELKGTVLLSTEGINLFVAGSEEAVGWILARLRAVPGLEDLKPKESRSCKQPFSRMLVRIKKEIIAFGVPEVDPARKTSPKLAPKALKQWLDEGRPVALLDTRNDYEVRLGTFRGAKTLGIDHFRQFPGAVESLPDDWKRTPVVMFCTGGIRCEKAGPYLESCGFSEVYQLEGGILKYFEECGGAHYDGECFVFDQRVGVDPALRETGTAQCFVCQAPLTIEDQRDPRYVPGLSCPFCHRPAPEAAAHELARRQEQLRRVATPLPGSVPEETRRPVLVPRKFDGKPLLEFLLATLPEPAEGTWRKMCEQGRWVDPQGVPRGADEPVRSGEKMLSVLPAVIEPDVNACIDLIHEDEALLVLNKPAPLPMHPGGRYRRNTLVHLLNLAFAPIHPRPAHRLDANTTGVLVCARTRHYSKLLQPQFERPSGSPESVSKSYLALVHGHPPDHEFVCEAPVSANPGPMGTRVVDDSPAGLPATTQFWVRCRNSDGTSLLEVRPLTGRTNQIRLHLWHLGFPVVGDPAYLPGRRLGQAMTIRPGDPSMCLHASEISLNHPLTNAAMTFSAPGPPWAIGCP